MFQKEIHMIYLVNKVFHRSRKDQNLKEEIIDLICLFHYQNSMKVDQWYLVLDVVKFVESVKGLVMKVVNCIIVKHVKGAVR
jgi:hypothetical protein